MKEFRGTKGEWLVDDIDVISRETGFAICQVYDGLDTHISEMDMEVVNANARLMATAPELLEALQAMLERFDYKEQSIYSFAAKEIDVAKVVIKKAIE